MAMPREQRALLLAAKLRTLVAQHWPELIADAAPVPFAGGAALLSPKERNVWVLIDETVIERDPMDQPDPLDALPALPRGWLGGAVLLAIRQQMSTLFLMAEHFTGDDARRSSAFGLQPTLFNIVGRSLTPVVAEEFVEREYPTAMVEMFSGLITQAGAEPVVEHGVLRAEVLGLEVGRAELDDDGVPQLSVGVGRHDRLAQSMMYGVTEVGRSLGEAVAAVRSYRRGDAGIHPANQLSPERWLRDLVVMQPSLANVAAPVTAVSGTIEPRLKVPSPAYALNASSDVLVACTVGVDLDAIAAAADAALFYGASRIHLVTPAGDDVPAIRELAAACRFPVDVVAVPRDWRNLAAENASPK